MREKLVAFPQNSNSNAGAGGIKNQEELRIKNAKDHSSFSPSSFPKDREGQVEVIAAWYGLTPESAEAVWYMGMCRHMVSENRNRPIFSVKFFKAIVEESRETHMPVTYVDYLKRSYEQLKAGTNWRQEKEE